MDRRTSSKPCLVNIQCMPGWEQLHVACGKTYIKAFSPKFHSQTNCSHSRGSNWLPSIGQKSCQSSQGVRRVVKTQTRTQWDFSVFYTQTHTHRKNAWLINAKKHVTLNWWCEIKWNKEKRKMKKPQRTKDATNVNVCSHGYWAGQSGAQHEEESLIQTEVHFTVVLALRGRNWEPFHDQRHLALGHKCLWSNARLKAMT